MPERWATIDRLYHEALERDASERGAFLTEACAGDDALRREVESLIAYDGKAEFLSTPALLDRATLVGRILGPYVISARIGAGGMGEVYRATDTNLARQVAIKVLPEAVASDAKALARFEREAKTLAALNHPNIAAIYGIERADDTTALVMELVEGPTLADRIAGGRISVDDALPMATQIAEALEAAHEQGIVHRDLKPANIKIREDGTVKVLDFGLAKARAPVGTISASESMSPTITTPAMTQAGTILGTAAYMSPEQARGRPVDKRADVWAFGCVLFEMLTGRRAFDGEDVSLTLAEVLKSEPDWTALPTLPPAVRMCLRQSLKKEPRQRLRDIGEARLALEGAFDVDALVDSSNASADAARSVWRWVLPSAAASAIVAATVTLWLRPNAQPPVPEVVRFEIHAPTGSKIPPGTPAISPDGRTLAYAVIGSDGTKLIHLRELGSTESRALPGTENAMHPFWSPDGRSLAFVNERDRTLKRIDVAGGPARELTRVTARWQGSLNQFGDLLFAASGGASRIPAEGGRAVPAVQPDEKAGEASAGGFPAFLSDGKRFLVRVDYEDGRSAIHLASLDSSDRKLVLDHVFSAALVAPTPRGTSYLLYLRDDALVAQEFDERTGEVRGTPRLVVDGIGKVGSPAVMPALGVSPSGAIAYQTGGESSVALSWLSRSGERLGEVPLEVPGWNPSLSPNGRLVAVEGLSRGDRDAWVTDLARGVTSRLTRGGGVVRGAIWSPDGRRIAFSRSGKIYVTEADGSAAETVLAAVEALPRSWSPDGKSLVYEVYEAQQSKLFLWPVTGGGKSIPLGSPSGASRDGRLSPDGRYLAYSSNESGREEIYLQALPPATGRVQVSAGGGDQPRWNRTNRELFFVSADQALMAVDVQLGQVPSAGVPRKLFPLDFGFTMNGYDVSADGLQFLVIRAREDVPDMPITVVLNWWAEFARRQN